MHRLVLAFLFLSIAAFGSPVFPLPVQPLLFSPQINGQLLYLVPFDEVVFENQPMSEENFARWMALQSLFSQEGPSGAESLALPLSSAVEPLSQSSPVPEPSTFALIFLGLIACACLHRRGERGQ